MSNKIIEWKSTFTLKPNQNQLNIENLSTAILTLKNNHNGKFCFFSGDLYYNTNNVYSEINQSGSNTFPSLSWEALINGNFTNFVTINLENDTDNNPIIDMYFMLFLFKKYIESINLLSTELKIIDSNVNLNIAISGLHGCKPTYKFNPFSDNILNIDWLTKNFEKYFNTNFNYFAFQNTFNYSQTIDTLNIELEYFAKYLTLQFSEVFTIN